MAGREAAEERAARAEKAAADVAAQAGQAAGAARALARAAQPPLPQPSQAAAPAVPPQPSVAIFQEEVIAGEMEVHGAPDQAPEQVSSTAGPNACLHGRQQCMSTPWPADAVLHMAGQMTQLVQV